MSQDPITILVVEDNDLDVEKIQRGFARLAISHPVVRARDGFEALEILRGDGGQQPPAKPYVVLLDLNMPRMNGIEFLMELRDDSKLASTPVFVLTTSDHERDVEAAYRHHVCGYMVKPIKKTDMLEALSTLSSYWGLSQFPSRRSGHA